MNSPQAAPLRLTSGVARLGAGNPAHAHVLGDIGNGFEQEHEQEQEQEYSEKKCSAVSRGEGGGGGDLSVPNDTVKITRPGQTR
jgi:hypothetical protein